MTVLGYKSGGRRQKFQGIKRNIDLKFTINALITAKTYWNKNFIIQTEQFHECEFEELKFACEVNIIWIHLNFCSSSIRKTFFLANYDKQSLMTMLWFILSKNEYYLKMSRNHNWGNNSQNGDFRQFTTKFSLLQDFLISFSPLWHKAHQHNVRIFFSSSIWFICLNEIHSLLSTKGVSRTLY